jgi:transcriptional regulator with XRE-family HTH domain
LAAGNEARSTRAQPQIGRRLRTARQTQGLSLRDLAGRLGVSASLISQIETGRAQPSVSTLYAIVGELGVSLDDLLFPDAERPDAERPAPALDPRMVERGMGIVGAMAGSAPFLKSTDRKRIRLASGVIWERLTTESEPDTEFLYVTYEVGGASSPEHEFQRHGGREWGFVLSGTLNVTIGFDDYRLEPGDSISIPSTVPHRLYNNGTEPVHAVWFVVGRNSIAVDAEGRRVRPDHATRAVAD